MAQRRRLTAVERFDAKYLVDPDTGCWLWQAARNWSGAGGTGYGQFWNGAVRENGSNVIVLAHRWSYERFRGPIPDGLGVLHSCDVTWCVNPDDLFLGTQLENVRDSIAKRRFHGRSLSPVEIAEIRSAYTGRYGQIIQLAERYGTSVFPITVAVRGMPRRFGRSRV